MQTLTAAYSKVSLPLGYTKKSFDRPFWIISFFVFLVHFLFIVWSAAFYNPYQPVYKAPEKFVVKTIALGESRPKAKVEISPPFASLPEEPLVQEPIAIVEENILKEEAVPIVQNVPKQAEPQVQEVVPNQVSATKEEMPPTKKEVAVQKPVVTKLVPKKNIKKIEAPTKSKPVSSKSVPQKSAVQKPPSKKMTVKKNEPKKNIEISKPDPKAEAMKNKKRELLAKAQESIGKIQKNSSKISPVKNPSAALASLPGKIEGLHIDGISNDSGSPLSASELSYRDELASRLKLLLKLPEYGQVKIKLTLERSGKVSKLDIVSAESAANRKYVEKTIPSLTLPAFGNYFSGKSEYTFAITLSNDI